MSPVVWSVTSKSKIGRLYPFEEQNQSDLRGRGATASVWWCPGGASVSQHIYAWIKVIRDKNQQRISFRLTSDVFRP